MAGSELPAKVIPAEGDEGATSTAGKVITCKAAVLWGPGEPLVIEEIEVDPPQKMEVRVRILFTTICHTDLSLWEGKNVALNVYPRILGHEASGVVESVGEGVKDLKEGDYVIPTFAGECGDCAYCNSEKTNLCETYRMDPMKTTMISDGKTRFFTTAGRRPIYHFLNTSTFSEYTVLDSACTVKVHPSAPLQKICLFSCGVSTGSLPVEENQEEGLVREAYCELSLSNAGVGAAWNTANVQKGSTVAVFGLGAVGLGAVEGARVRGASQIIGVDVNSEKYTKAKEMGATDFINPKEHSKPVHEVISSMIKGGVDYSFECVGNLDVLREAFMSTHEGWGFCVVLGVPQSLQLLPLYPFDLFSGRRIVGSVFGDVKGKSQLPDMVDKYMSGVLKVDGLITHELPFEEINSAMQLLAEGKSLRCVLSL